VKRIILAHLAREIGNISESALGPPFMVFAVIHNAYAVHLLTPVPSQYPLTEIAFIPFRSTVLAHLLRKNCRTKNEPGQVRTATRW
jgi:hypothetical protein